MLSVSLASIIAYPTVTNVSISISDTVFSGDGNILSILNDGNIYTGNFDNKPYLASPPPVSRPPLPSPSLSPDTKIGEEDDSTNTVFYGNFNLSNTMSSNANIRKSFNQLVYQQVQFQNLLTKQIPRDNPKQFIQQNLPNVAAYFKDDPDPTLGGTDNAKDEQSSGSDISDLSMYTLNKEGYQSNNGIVNTQIHKTTDQIFQAVLPKYPSLQNGDDSLSPLFSGHGNVAGSIGNRRLGIVQQNDGLPIDERTQVSCGTTSGWAWQTIVSIGGYCTGTLVSPNTVMTAGHCIFATGDDTWMEPPYIEIHPCKGDSSGAGQQYSWKRMRTFRGWVNGLRGWDAGIIELSGGPTSGPGANGNAGYLDGWKSFGYTSAITLGWTWNLAGYPGDKPFQTMWTDYDGMCTSSHHSDCSGNPFEQTFLYRLDTRGGQSGSGVYIYRPNSLPQRVIYGIHTSWSGAAGDTALDTSYNRATRMRLSIFNSFCDFIDNSYVC